VNLEAKLISALEEIGKFRGKKKKQKDQLQNMKIRIMTLMK
jgi:hypothetical protein